MARVIGLALLMSASLGASYTSLDQPGASNAVPVLVELFTAEGCSSCPPADLLLEKMLAAQPAAGVVLVGLGEHVDYWNRSGWKDRFSSAALTKRQQQYAARSGTDDVYTPEMVVDGGSGFVGTDIEAARRAIEQAASSPHGDLGIRLEAESSQSNKVGAVVTIRSLPPTAGDDPPDLLVAITEDGLHTDVKRGENQGRALTHAVVVRELVTVASATPGSAPLHATLRVDPAWHRENLKIVAFVQQRRSRRVLATAVEPLGGHR
jgi:hypothetical protein